MELQIQLRCDGAAMVERLQRDGWRIEAKTPHSLSAFHPEVASQPEARQRLHRLGLLTSRTMQITFPVVPAHSAET